MKRVLKSLALAAAILLGTQASAVTLEPQNVDAVKLDKAPVWNAKGLKSSNTVFKLVAKDGTSLGGLNYALVDVGGTTRLINAPLSLTQAACATDWGSSGTHDVYVYVGYAAASKTPNLCVSDKPNQTTYGSVTVGNTGYNQCGATMASGDAMHQIGHYSLNCTGPVIGTYVDNDENVDGQHLVPVKFYGSASNTSTGSASLDFTVQGMTTSEKCVVTASALGTGVSYIAKAVTAAGKITATADASQSGGTTTINYICY